MHGHIGHHVTSCHVSKVIYSSRHTIYHLHIFPDGLECARAGTSVRSVM